MRMAAERLPLFGDVPLFMGMSFIVQGGSHKSRGQKRLEFFQQSYTTTGEESVKVTAEPDKVVQ